VSAPLSRRAGRLAHSPTFTTWLSLAARSVDLLLVLPLGLHYLPPADAAVWLLVLAIPRFFQVAEYGFGATFVRLLAYTRGAAAQGLDPGEASLAAAWQAIRWTYNRLAVLVGIGAVVFGTMALLRPISGSTQAESAWLAWTLVAFTNPFLLQGQAYANFLVGVDRVAYVRRWEAIGVLIGSLATISAIWAGAGLAALVAARQAGQLVNAAVYRWLFRRSDEGRTAAAGKDDGERDRVLRIAWPAAWRSFLGGLMSVGLIELSGILYAQFGVGAAITSYLLAVRMIQALIQFANAPFYSRLPLYARLYSENRVPELLTQAATGMRRALWVFVAGFFALGMLVPVLLRLAGSQTPFPAPWLWFLLGLAFFGERVGAMHLQLFSTTNIIRWHIANGIYGAIFLTVAAFLARYLGAYAFPLGWMAGNFGFYIWYCARLSYRTFSLRFWEFERRSSLLPFAALMIYGLALWTLGR
jgi:hypothetical protein